MASDRLSHRLSPEERRQAAGAARQHYVGMREGKVPSASQRWYAETHPFYGVPVWVVWIAMGTAASVATGLAGWVIQICLKRFFHVDLTELSFCMPWNVLGGGC